MNDELTLKDILLLIGKYYNEIKSKWKLLLFTCVVTMLFFAYKCIVALPNYKADTKFYLENDSGGISGIGGLLGQIGFKQGGGNNPNQILEVAQSKILLVDILFHKDNDQDEYLINQILDSYNFPEKWAKKSEVFKGFRFHHSNLDSLSYNEKTRLLKIQNLILKGDKEFNPLRSISYDIDNGFFEIKTNTISDTISLRLSNLTFDYLKNHFEFKAISNLIRTRDILKLKSDSIKSELVSKMYAKNRFGDRSQGLVSLEVRTQRDILDKEVSGLTMAHAELYRQLELANFSIENSKDKFILIDRPFEPIFPIKPELLIELIKGLLFGLILASLFVIGRKVIRDNLEE